MQIQAIQNNQYKHKPVSFRNLSRAVSGGKAFGKTINYRNDTCFFRNSDIWENFVKFFSEKFKNVPKVNTYCYGCSDGSEPFTFIMSLFSNLEKKEAKKFLPIKAKDIDKEVINNVKSRELYFLKNSEKTNINQYTCGKFKDYFSEKKGIGEIYFAQAKDILYDNVQFSVADISKDYKKIKPNNSIIFARNFWPYIKEHSLRKQFLKQLYNHLEKNSFFIIGDFDINGTACSILEEIESAGFVKTSVENVFTKIAK